MLLTTKFTQGTEHEFATCFVYSNCQKKKAWIQWKVQPMMCNGRSPWHQAPVKMRLLIGFRKQNPLTLILSAKHVPIEDLNRSRKLNSLIWRKQKSHRQSLRRRALQVNRPGVNVRMTDGMLAQQRPSEAPPGSLIINRGASNTPSPPLLFLTSTSPPLPSHSEPARGRRDAGGD